MNSLFKTVTDSASPSQLTAQDDDKSVVSFQSPQVLEQKIFIKNLELEMSIGVMELEKSKMQRVIVDAELTVIPPSDWKQDDISNVVSYTDVIEIIKALSKNSHVELAETFAEMIIEDCFKEVSVIAATVSVEKPDIIDGDTKVGARISRQKV